MKSITLPDFLTEQEIQRSADLWKSCRSTHTNFAKAVCAEIVLPNMDRINLALGQENDPMYLSYAIEFVLNERSA